jgi:hypothetical protein
MFAKTVRCFLWHNSNRCHRNIETEVTRNE